jgi:acetolactate synthase-1/2/3 large subunit
MTVADFIFKYFSSKGVSEVFMVTGGHAMYLNDAVAKNKDLHYICTHHEQAATMAGEAYGRLENKPAIAMITAGPGSVNAITGVVGAWVDSAPLIVISGQSNLPIVSYQEKTSIRQFGVQGISIRKMVTPITKYFTTVDDARKAIEYLDKAWEEVTTGRPGPVWLEVPLDIQRAEMPEDIIKLFENRKALEKIKTPPELLSAAKKVFEKIKSADRPLFIFGQGIRLAGAEDILKKVLDIIQIPIITSRLGIDVVTSDNPQFVGRPGTYGDRPANFSVQNADLIISVGCRLTISLTGHNVKDFGRNAEKIMVDIDHKELEKPDLNINFPILADAKDFLLALYEVAEANEKIEKPEWLKRCQNWKEKYPTVLPSYKDEKPVNSYYFTDKLSDLAPKDAYILVDTGTCFHVAAQVWKIKSEQRFLTTGGISSMGYWAAGIGACVANKKRDTIVITGDGSLQMNIQEFATIRGNNLPIKLFIFNNNGYLLIRHTQKNFFDKRMIGEGPESGVWCPDSLKIAAAYGIPAVRINSVDEVESKIKEVFATPGPVICDVMTPEWQLIIPRVTSEKDKDGKLVSRPFEDMFPFLSPEELEENMIVKKK